MERDASTRMTIRSDLRHRLAADTGSTVIVTHDPLDAMILAQRLVVIEPGRAVQIGPPADVARAARTTYVARLLGLNLYRGTADGTALSGALAAAPRSRRCSRNQDCALGAGLVARRGRLRDRPVDTRR